MIYYYEFNICIYTYTSFGLTTKITIGKTCHFLNWDFIWINFITSRRDFAGMMIAMASWPIEVDDLPMKSGWFSKAMLNDRRVSSEFSQVNQGFCLPQIHILVGELLHFVWNQGDNFAGRDCGDQHWHRASGSICCLDSPASWPIWSCLRCKAWGIRRIPKSPWVSPWVWLSHGRSVECIKVSSFRTPPCVGWFPEWCYKDW